MSAKLFLSTSLALASLAAALGFAQTPKKPVVDKAALEAYVRHLFVMDKRITVQVQDPKPSTELPGFYDVTVHASAGVQAQDFQFFVSHDGGKIIQGNVYDLAANPFKSSLDKLKTEGAANFGTQGAPVVLVEFSDFECPFCKEEASMLRANIPAGYGKQVHVYFKPFPLQQHQWAKQAAIAGACIAHQSNDTFWTYHDWIFLHQSDMTPENLKTQILEWAKLQQGLNTASLEQCIDTNATAPEIEKSIAEGKALGVGQTPTLFVNGRRLDGAIDWPSLKNIIDYEIEYQKTAKNAGEDCGCELKLNLPGFTQSKTPQLVPPKK